MKKITNEEFNDLYSYQTFLGWSSQGLGRQDM